MIAGKHSSFAAEDPREAIGPDRLLLGAPYVSEAKSREVLGAGVIET